MWNGTEFEELSIPAPAVNVPYYYIDPTDNNYAYLVVCDENGANQKEIRLPLNEGLAQIQIINSNFNTSLEVNYGISRIGVGYAEWNGPKAKPAAGEYMTAQATDTLIVQVTPANYDLASLELKVLDSNNDEVPMVLGEPIPYKGLMSRATSGTGLYKIPVSVGEISEELTDKYEKKSYYGYSVSLYANDKVRSPYGDNLTFSLNEKKASDINTGDIRFNSRIYQGALSVITLYVEPGKSFTLPVTSGKEYLYDAYITMYDGNDKDKVDQAKADQIRYGIKCEGLTVSAESASTGSVAFSLHYIDVAGNVRRQDFNIRFNEVAEIPETPEVTLAASTHTATTKVVSGVSQQFILVDLAEYFNTMNADERLVWNDNIDQYNRLADVFNIKGQYSEDYSEYGDAKHIYNDGGVSETKFVNILGNVTPVKSDGTPATKASEIAKLKIAFNADYKLDSETSTYKWLTEGEYTSLISVSYRLKDENQIKERTVLTAPFTIADPTDAEITSLFKFNTQYYANGVLTILLDDIDATNGTSIDLQAASGVEYITSSNVDFDGIKVTGTNAPTVVSADKSVLKVKKAGEWTVSGIKFTVLGKEYDAPSFKLKVAVAQPYSVDFTKASPVVTSGMQDESTIIEYYKPTGIAQTDALHTNYYNIKSATGAVQADNFVTNIAFDYDPSLITIAPDNNDNIKITPNDVKVTVDTTVKVKATFSMSNGETVDYEFNVTVKAYPM